MTKNARNTLWVALTLAGIVLLAYLLRNVAAPPNCELEPDAPACQGKP